MDKNLSEALLMAGSIILGIILFSTFIYMMRLGGSVNKAYDETQISYQTEGFNYQFEIYQRDDNTIMDMVTLLNLAYSVNSDNDYDRNNSVTIELRIGGKTYRIPKVTKEESSDAEDFYNKNSILVRNKIYDTTGSPHLTDSNGLMSVYYLLDKTMSELGISGSGLTGTDKLSKIHIGDYVNYPDLPASDPNAGKPVKGSNGTTYKYVFKCVNEEMEYNNATGRVSKMVFRCEINPNWELGPLSESPEWD